MGHSQSGRYFPVFDDRGDGADGRRDRILSRTTPSGSRAVYFMTIDKAKFRKPVVPGDTIEYHMTKIAQRRNMWWYRRGRGRGASWSRKPK